jgi:serine protease Do
MTRAPVSPVVLIAAACGLAAVAAHAGEPTAIEAAGAMEKVLVEAIAKAEKSVVAIARVRRPGSTIPRESRPDPFGRLSPPPGPVRPLEPTDPDFVPNEYATGVVVDARGLIVTAYHVLAEESDYYVTTHDRKVRKAWVKGADPRSDLAVLSIDATDLQPIALGDASTLRRGQIVITLGNPYAIARDGQVSAGWGIVSNLARKAPPTPEESDSTGKKTLHHFGTLIQTDARLNLGTSGGALLNLKGQMIGLTVALAATAGYETAAGYAISVDDTFRRAVDLLKQGKEVEYGFLGVQPANLRPAEVVAGLHGVKVDHVESGTPAFRFGIKADDLITAVNGTPLYEADGLVREVGKLPVEAVARLSVLRDGAPRLVSVTLSKYPVSGRKIVTQPPAAWRGMKIDYGTVHVEAEGTAKSSRRFTDEAVVVTEVAEDTAAWAAGVRRGTFISHVGRTQVRTPKEFHAAAALRSGPVDLRVLGEKKNPILTVGP